MKIPLSQRRCNVNDIGLPKPIWANIFERLREEHQETNMPASFLIPVIYLAFISLGLPDSVLGVAWPAMRLSLGSPLEAAGLIALILTSCSAVSSVASGFVAKRLGTGPVVLVSSLLTALGLFGYSLSPSYAWVLVSALPLGFGAGAVDTTLNGYVATHYSSRHMNWLHASWGVGATIGPLIMTGVIAGGGTWRRGYQAISGVQAFLALLFFLSLGLWNRVASARQAAALGAGNVDRCLNARGKKKIHGMGRPEPWIQIVMYALYSASEFTVGIWTVSMLEESRHVAAGIAGGWISLYYGGIMAGRILTGLVADRMGNRRMVRIGLGIALAGSVLLILRSADWLVLPGLLLLGLGFAPVYPCLMHETPERFDDETYQKVIGFQVGAANIGASVLPGLVGLLASATSLEAVGPCVAVFVALLIVLGEILNRRT
jgi:fucose permease